MQQWNLIILRKQHGYTQPQLAELVGINPRTYFTKETGKSQFTADEMFKIADIFQKPMEEIFLPSYYENLVVMKP